MLGGTVYTYDNLKKDDYYCNREGISEDPITIRTCLAGFIRKGLNFSKTMTMHQKSLDLFQAWYNFIKPHDSLKVKVDSHNKNGCNALLQWQKKLLITYGV